MPVTNMDTASQPVYNTFTKSYRTRYVVHASRKGDKLTLCGRQIDQRSKESFDGEIDGACQKCVQKMTIEVRIHPGFAG